jgi:hypothetical protein
MKLHDNIIALALVSMMGMGATTALALNLQSSDRTIIYETVEARNIAAPAPSGWRAQIGAPVPSEIELYDLPAIEDIPSMDGYRYALLDRDVVLVDPVTDRVVDVIKTD